MHKLDSAAQALVAHTLACLLLTAQGACGPATRTAPVTTPPSSLAPNTPIPPPAPTRPANSPAEAPLSGSVLTVRVPQPERAASVGWASADGKRLALLNPVYEAATPTWRGEVPAEPLQIYIDGLGPNNAREARATLDMSAGHPQEITVALEQPRKLTTRQVVVRDRKGKPLIGVTGEPLLDGSQEAVRVGVMNYQQWVSDGNGQLTVRSVEGAPVQLALSLPLLETPVLATLAPGAEEVVLRDVTIVRCSFRCPANNKPAPYPGFVAVAKLKNGTSVRYELPESDGLRSEPAALAWPPGTRSLTVSSSPYKEVSITSPTALCELHPLPSRQCEGW